jgi:DNA-binding response OmpR family regulator
MSLSEIDPADMSREQLIEYCYSLEAQLNSEEAHNDLVRVLRLQSQFKLTSSEAKFVALLSEGRLYTKEYLLAKLYPVEADAPGSKIIDVFLCKIRRKIAPFGLTINTIWGGGVQAEQPELIRAVMSGATIELPGEVSA